MCQTARGNGRQERVRSQHGTKSKRKGRLCAAQGESRAYPLGKVVDHAEFQRRLAPDRVRCNVKKEDGRQLPDARLVVGQELPRALDDACAEGGVVGGEEGEEVKREVRLEMGRERQNARRRTMNSG